MKRKTVLITGASRGIGAEMARKFAENNYNVVIDYNESKEKAEALLKEIIDKGGSAIAIKADMRVPEEVENLFNTATKIFGGIDVLINNAAVALGKLFIDTTLEEYENVFNTNIRGNFLITKLVLPQMISRGKGRIINLSSVWGQTGGSCEVAYSAAKAGLIGFTKALAKELAPSGITVNCVSPGCVESKMLAGLDHEALKEMIPTGKLCSGLDIAKCILFLAEQEQITGQVLSPNGGMYM